MTDTTSINYIAFDSTGAERLDGFEPGLYAFVIGFGRTREEALTNANFHLGVRVAGLTVGTTDDPEINAESAARGARVFRANKNAHFRAA